jgi:hypothetical protein
VSILKHTKSWLACFGALVLLSPLAFAQDQPADNQNTEQNLKSYIDLLRHDLNKEKVAILTELMDLDSNEAAKFWPIYNEYTKTLHQLADERLALIRLYADNYATLTDEMATKIAVGAMDVEAKRIALRKEYFQKFSSALTAKDAARWLQIETQIEKLLDLQILASLPIVE